MDCRRRKIFKGKAFHFQHAADRAVGGVENGSCQYALLIQDHFSGRHGDMNKAALRHHMIEKWHAGAIASCFAAIGRPALAKRSFKHAFIEGKYRKFFGVEGRAHQTCRPHQDLAGCFAFHGFRGLIEPGKGRKLSCNPILECFICMCQTFDGMAQYVCLGLDDFKRMKGVFRAPEMTFRQPTDRYSPYDPERRIDCKHIGLSNNVLPHGKWRNVEQ